MASRFLKRVNEEGLLAPDFLQLGFCCQAGGSAGCILQQKGCWCRSICRQQLKAPGTLGSLGNGASPSPFPELVLICAGAISMQLATLCPFKSILSSVLNQQPTALSLLQGLRIEGTDWKDFFLVFLKANYINCIFVYI